MTSSLLIAHPDIPFNATSVSATFGADTGFSINNIITGPRGEIFKAATDFNTNNFTFDLGSGNTASADYFIVARTDLLYRHGQGGTFIYLQGSTDNFSASTVTVSSRQLTATNGLGPRGEDRIETFATSTAYRYWRLKTEDGGLLVRGPFSKFYAGTLFDMGREPSFPRVLDRNVRSARNRDAAYMFEMRWEGVTDAKRNSFISKIGRYIDINPVFLYTSTYTDLLFDHTMMHCKIVRCRIDPVSQNNSTIICQFEELI